jgi:hypothetical protein
MHGDWIVIRLEVSWFSIFYVLYSVAHYIPWLEKSPTPYFFICSSYKSSSPPLRMHYHYLYSWQLLELAHSPLLCRNICLRYPRMQVDYRAGGKYCRRCEYYFFTERLFCECCGMRLRSSPTNRGCTLTRCLFL